MKINIMRISKERSKKRLEAKTVRFFKGRRKIVHLEIQLRLKMKMMKKQHLN